MGKAVRVVCLMIVAVVVLLGTSSPGYADPPDQVTIVLKDDGTTTGLCDIHLKDKGNQFKGVCKKNPNPKKCKVTEFSWKVENETGAEKCNMTNWTLVIKNAPDHLECFPDARPEPWFVAKFDAFDQVRTSGPPSEVCSQDKFGTYWPYVISLYDDGGLVDSTDPGGIIFP